MDRAVPGLISALELASNLSGIPYLGAAATCLAAINDGCQKVGTNKSAARSLSRRCTELINTLGDYASHAQDEQLRRALDELEPVLDRIRNRVTTWSTYSRGRRFLKNGEIEEGLKRCEKELDTAMQRFSLHTQAQMIENQRTNQDEINMNFRQSSGILYDILTSQQEILRVVRMQNNGNSTVAEDLMRAGQEQLRSLRQDEMQVQVQALERQEQSIDVIMAASESAVPRSMSPAPMSRFAGPTHTDRYQQFERGLVDLHRQTGVLPSIKRLDGEVTKTGKLPQAGGVYSDVWQGTWLGGEKVALKALRSVRVSQRAQDRFEHEINVWARLKHEHVMPFYGIVTQGLGQNLHMVSPWQENGNAIDYIRKNPETNKVHLMAGAAQGLSYLHSANVVHGNVKCSNIMVSRTGEALICDFGMSTIIEEVTENAASATLTAGGSARWLAPELIQGSVVSPTQSTDVYSFGMAILECLTLKHPYANCKRDANVIHAIVTLKQQPEKPKGPGVDKWLTSDLWKLMQEAWSPADRRPRMEEIALGMEDIEDIFRAWSAAPLPESV